MTTDELIRDIQARFETVAGTLETLIADATKRSKQVLALTEQDIADHRKSNRRVFIALIIMLVFGVISTIGGSIEWYTHNMIISDLKVQVAQLKEAKAASDQRVVMAEGRIRDLEARLGSDPAKEKRSHSERILDLANRVEELEKAANPPEELEAPEPDEPPGE